MQLSDHSNTGQGKVLQLGVSIKPECRLHKYASKCARICMQAEHMEKLPFFMQE
jgi:hypothetical protein